VRDFKVVVDGKPQHTWREAIQALLGKQADFQYGQSTVNGVIIPAGQTVHMFRYANQPDAEKIYKAMERLDFFACFCSVFDECWRTSYRQSARAEPVDRCQNDADSFTD
jgi:hypothetical protein